jgi:hypothetical protein
LTTNTQTYEIGCELYIHDDKELFNSIYNDKKHIENVLDGNVQWMPLPDKKASKKNP